MMNSPRRRLNLCSRAALFLFVALGFACDQPATLPALPPDEIVQRAAGQMLAVTGFHFVIDRGGAPAYLDAGQTIAFRRAEGYYVAPDKARATVRIIAPGLVADVHLISIGAIQWETNAVTGRWQELPPDWGFNPAVLFDPQIGLQSILERDLSQLELRPPQRLKEGPPKQLYTVAGQLDGRRLHTLSDGLLGPETMAVTLWIDPDDFNLHRVLVITPGDENEATTWQLDFAEFDRVVSIQPPP
jgi:lipoprotein LprG